MKTMKWKKTWLMAVSLLLICALFLVACEPADAERTPAPGEPGAIPQTGEDLDQEPPVDGEAVVQTAEVGDFGTILVDHDGMTLYEFANDEPNQSNCTGECLDNWPPLISLGDPAAGEGVNEGDLGTIEREDGQLQVTYREMPLYYWVGDVGPGDTGGHGLNDAWFVVEP
jgi:predicted lipoprotein with Yx(FWY)xxD motif